MVKTSCSHTSNNLKSSNTKGSNRFTKAFTFKASTKLIQCNITKELCNSNSNLKCNNLKWSNKDLPKDLLKELFSNLNNRNSLNKLLESSNNNKLSNKLLSSQLLFNPKPLLKFHSKKFTKLSEDKTELM